MLCWIATLCRKIVALIDVYDVQIVIAVFSVQAMSLVAIASFDIGPLGLVGMLFSLTLFAVLIRPDTIASQTLLQTQLDLIGIERQLALRERWALYSRERTGRLMSRRESVDCFQAASMTDSGQDTRAGQRW
ncbi:hypothetical protein [Parasphingorhabdus cellanae]|uniref:Uncharacterized protein n=1 Tax=Parasphingorhabdus cellanae TaxID=2806553 RepID=A0ABX7T6N6_9SPHN|nr:hypothetical protein [Parasphingorhabdus cellanae]QTD57264.1 hypothetical protein J4G78_06940 [Parasphingorhabdus cellanae]